MSEALRQESPNVRVTEVSPGFVATGFSKTIGDADIRNTIEKRQQELGIPPETVAGAIAYRGFIAVARLGQSAEPDSRTNRAF